MNEVIEFKEKIKSLIDNLKSICRTAGLGNSGNEYQIITQVFLYKFLNDKFLYEIEKKMPENNNLESELKKLKKDKYEMLMMELDPNIARLKPDQFISSIYEKQNEKNFSKIFDDNLLEIANYNNEIFSVLTSGGKKIILFEEISQHVNDKKDKFCKALINELITFNFKNIFDQKFDFFADIFEYLINDYNSNKGGIYAEYFTPHSVAKIMASCLVNKKFNNVTCYDPSAGSGTLLMNLAHTIQENKCTIYSEDISLKSTQLLRLNIILNNLVHSIPNIIQGDTILEPFHRDTNNNYKKFDFVVSNPPFKLDFSKIREELDTKENHERFFAGIPAIPKKEPERMAIYLLFIQHIIFSLSEKGKSSIVVPTGFLTATGNIETNIRKHIIDNKMLRGVIVMPPNIFAETNTNVSILFLDKEDRSNDAILIDASNLGTTYKQGKKKKTILSNDDELLITKTFSEYEGKDDFSKIVSFDKIKSKKYIFSPGIYFDLKFDVKEISQEEFDKTIKDFETNLENLFKESSSTQKKLKEELKKIKYGD